MEPDLEALRRQRAEAWRKAVAPHVRDMARSGFPSFIVLAALVALSGYTAFLENVPPGFPIAAICAVVMTLLMVRSPLRTHLRPADAVFLMPREHEMGRYMRGARRSGTIAGCVGLVVAWLICAPFYGKSDAPTEAAALVPALLILKVLSDVGAWQERRMARGVARRLCRLLRAALTLAVVYALLTKPLLAALGFAAVAAALQAAVCRLPARHRFPWQRLFDEEARTRRRYERFFRSFTDLPAEAETPARRPYAAWVAGRIRHSRDHTYLMLYTLALIRTDIGGMLIRLTAVGVLVGAVTGASGALAGWAGALAAWLFALAAGVQAGTVRHTHRNAVWRHVYPLPEAGRRDAGRLPGTRAGDGAPPPPGDGAGGGRIGARRLSQAGRKVRQAGRVGRPDGQSSRTVRQAEQSRKSNGQALFCGCRSSAVSLGAHARPKAPAAVKMTVSGAQRSAGRVLTVSRTDSGISRTLPAG